MPCWFLVLVLVAAHAPLALTLAALPHALLALSHALLALPHALAALPLALAHALALAAALPADRVPRGLHAALLAVLHAARACWPMFCCWFSASSSASDLALSKIPMIPPLPSPITGRMPVISFFRDRERRLPTPDCSIYPPEAGATDRLSLAIEPVPLAAWGGVVGRRDQL